MPIFFSSTLCLSLWGGPISAQLCAHFFYVLSQLQFFPTSLSFSLMEQLAVTNLELPSFWPSLYFSRLSFPYPFHSHISSSSLFLLQQVSSHKTLQTLQASWHFILFILSLPPSLPFPTIDPTKEMHPCPSVLLSIYHLRLSRSVSFHFLSFQHCLHKIHIQILRPSSSKGTTLHP